MIVDAVKSADLETKVNARMFALEFSAVLDGLSIQVALEDPEVDSDLAYDIAMRFAERELNLPPRNNRPVGLKNAERVDPLRPPGRRWAAVLRCRTRTASCVQTQFTPIPGSWVTERGPEWLGTSTIARPARRHRRAPGWSTRGRPPVPRSRYDVAPGGDRVVRAVPA